MKAIDVALKRTPITAYKGRRNVESANVMMISPATAHLRNDSYFVMWETLQRIFNREL
jgi:hypothetical protein